MTKAKHNTAIDREWFDQQIADAGYSLRGLARRINMDPSALSRTLSGHRRMQLTEVKSLATALRASEADVLEHAYVDVPDDKKGFSEVEQTPLVQQGNGRKSPAVVPMTQHDSKGRKLSSIFGALKGTTIVAPGVNLAEPADPDWGKVYDEGHDFGPIGGIAKGKRS